MKKSIRILEDYIREYTDAIEIHRQSVESHSKTHGANDKEAFWYSKEDMLRRANDVNAAYGKIIGFSTALVTLNRER